MDRKYLEAQGEELLNMILDEDVSLAERDEMLYCILYERLVISLSRKFEPYRGKIDDGFDDMLQDYYLYLRGEDGEPYRKLKKIRNASSFDGWLVITFRNFVGRKVAVGRLLPKTVSKPDFLDSDEIYMDNMVSDERLIEMLSTLIAYCCQEFNPISRFIFLRTLLGLLGTSRELPEKEVSAALGITDVYYRVLNHRLRCKVLKFKDILMSGAILPLTRESRCLAEELNINFNDWSQKISDCYEDALSSLPQSEAINKLRIRHTAANEGMLYDPFRLSYGYNDVRSFWKSMFSYFRESLA